MKNQFNKEDLGLSVDVETFESSANMFDTPMEVLQICFPNEDNHKELLHNFYIRYAAPFLDYPEQYTIEEIIDRVSKKARKSTHEIDLEVKWMIEMDFTMEVQVRTNLSESILDSTPRELWFDTNVMKEKLTVVEDEVEIKKVKDLTDKDLYDNKLMTGKK